MTRGCVVRAKWEVSYQARGSMLASEELTFSDSVWESRGRVPKPKRHSDLIGGVALAKGTL